MIKTINAAYANLNSKEGEDNPFAEVENQGKYKSDYVVQLYDVFIDDDSCVNLVMEYCMHGDLNRFLEKQ